MMHVKALINMLVCGVDQQLQRSRVQHEQAVPPLTLTYVVWKGPIRLLMLLEIGTQGVCVCLEQICKPSSQHLCWLWTC